jgi:TPR repeat protein
MPGIKAFAGDTTNNESANEAMKRMSAYQEEASRLKASSVFAELEKLRTVLAIKQQSSKSVFVLDDDTYKATGYAMDLQARRKVNDAAGAYYYGVYNLRVCGGLQSADKGGQFSDTVKQCFLESLESFKVASTAKMGAASFNVGRMYESGWGVLPSKLVAADWFVKAAQQFTEASSREEALTAIEAALTAVPDHPQALKLKKAFLQ